MKKNQSAAGIAKPHDANGSDTITNLRDQRLAPPGKWAACSLILRCPIMTQNPSLTGWGGGRWWCLCVGGLCSHCVCGVHYSLNERPFLHYITLHYISEKGDAGRCGGKTGRTQMTSECNADTVCFQHEPGKYIHLYFLHDQQLSAETGHFFPPKSRYVTGKLTAADDSFYIKN